MTRLLFIAKQRKVGPYSYSSIGLLNSIQFVKEELNKRLEGRVHVEAVTVVDNNEIDKVVTHFKPHIVVIDALWVVPEKFKILKKLHPRVEWIVRIHSEVPFLANEGVAFEWLPKYHAEQVNIAVNSRQAKEQLEAALGFCVLCLPNLYPIKEPDFKQPNMDRIIKIGCFGAIRPLKNQLLQAVAAIKFADDNGYLLEFHINGDRVERGGDEILKNIRSLFKYTQHTKLVEHPWYPHKEFLKVMKTMDASMCVSFTETFCIVAADTVSSGVPLVGSSAIPWIGSISKTSLTNVSDMVCTLRKVLGYKGKKAYIQNHKNLIKYNEEGVCRWVNELSL